MEWNQLLATRVATRPSLTKWLIPPLLLGVYSSTLNAADEPIYKQVNTDGSVEFSDKKAHNSTTVTPAAVNIMVSPPTPAPTPAPTQTAEKASNSTHSANFAKTKQADQQRRGDTSPKLGAATPGSDDLPAKPSQAIKVNQGPPVAAGDIKRVDIIAPSQQQTLYDHKDTLKVHYYTLPAKRLGETQSARVLLNDKLVARSQNNQITLPMPKRGKHQVRVEITDKDGAVIAQSPLIDVLVEKLVVPLTIR